MVTIKTMAERWGGLDRPLFKGKLIDRDGCKCDSRRGTVFGRWSSSRQGEKTA